MPTYKSGARIQLHFHIKMQEKDKDLLESVKNRIGCGGIYFQKEKRANHCQCYRYTVGSQRDILTKVIPFFEENSLQSFSKRNNFKIFCQIAKLVEKEAHRTKSGVEKIRQLKSEMNQRTVGLA